MRNDTMGIILTGDEKIAPLTNIRANSALPIAGRYRIIDFVLSNMANSGITNVGIATESNYSSLMDHTRSGKPWDLDRKDQGLQILPPNIENEKYGVIRGNIDLLAGIRDYIHRSKQTYVILSLGNMIYNIDFDAVVKEHIENQSDITIIYRNVAGLKDSDLSRFTLLELDEEKRVKDIEVQPYYPKTTNVSLEIFVMEKVLLESFIDECSSRGDVDFVKDAIIKKMNGMRMYGYEFDGHFYKVDSIDSYYKTSMEFLKAERREELFNSNRPIYTKTKDQCPAKYGDEAECINSFISDGCVIEGTVINSILSRGVKVGKGAIVRNSVIMQDSVIEDGAEISHVVFDKEVVITSGRKLIGQDTHPLPIAKGTII